MSDGTSRNSGAPDRRYWVPEVPKCYSGETDPIQRLFAFAYVQAQSARREAEVRKDADCLSAVIAAQQHIAADHLDRKQCLEFIVEQARRIIGADGAAIALRDGEDFICCGSSGVIAPELGARVDPQSGISGECLRTGEIQQCDNAETDSRVEPLLCRRQGIRSILAVPVQHHEVLGILEVFAGWAGVFSERDVRTLSLLAGLVVAQLPQQAGDLAGAGETQPAPPGLETRETPPAAELPPAALALREARGRRGRRTKILVLSLAVLAAASEAVVWRGLHIQGVVGIAKGFFVAPTPGAMPAPSTPAITLPGAATPPSQTIVETVPERTPSPASTQSSRRERPPKSAPSEKSPPAPIKTPHDENLEASVIASPASGRVEGPVDLHSPFAGVEKIVQPEPINPEASTSLSAPKDVGKVHENSQTALPKHKTAKSQAQLEQILEFRGELKDRMHNNLSRAVGAVSVRFAVYAQPQGGAPLWQEMQYVEVDRFGHFIAQVGSNSGRGFPPFANALWLGWWVQLPGEVERRVWLVNTPSGLMGEGAVGRMLARNPVDPEGAQASGSATGSPAAKPRHVD